MRRKRAFTGTSWESRYGYCRAIRVGDHIYVTGTAPVSDDGSVFAPGDPEAQARRCFDIIGRALTELGASPADLVRTRMFVTHISHSDAFGRAHKAFVGEHAPATTMVEVRALIEPEMLIEIEADAVVTHAG